MPSRAPGPRAILAAVIASTLVLCAAARPAAAQEKKKTHVVVRYVAYQDDGRYRYQGKPLMVLAVESLDGRAAELLVPNRDMNKNDRIDPLPRVLDTVRALKKGDPIRIELDDAKPRPYVVDVKPYKLKPGETDPKAYVFENSFRKEEGRSTYTAVVLSRFDEHTTYAVQQKRDKDGDMSSDPAIIELLPKLKTGDVVEAEVKPGGAVPTLTSLERYAMPQNGKFVKVTELDVDGQKAPAVELERDGKAVTAVVAGKAQGKRWVPDPKVLAAAKKLKPDAEVVFRARDDDGKLWLKEIEPAPKAPEESARERGARPTPSRESTTRNDRRDAKDAAERPARGEK
jgi:hypothetical protein